MGNWVVVEEGNRDGEHNRRSNAIDELEEQCKWLIQGSCSWDGL